MQLNSLKDSIYAKVGKKSNLLKLRDIIEINKNATSWIQVQFLFLESIFAYQYRNFPNPTVVLND